MKMNETRRLVVLLFACGSVLGGVLVGQLSGFVTLFGGGIALGAFAGAGVGAARLPAGRTRVSPWVRTAKPNLSDQTAAGLAIGVW